MALIGLQEDLIRKSYSKKNSVPEEDQSFDLNLNKNMNRNKKNVVIQNYVGALSCTVIAITTAISLRKDLLK